MKKVSTEKARRLMAALFDDPPDKRYGPDPQFEPIHYQALPQEKLAIDAWSGHHLAEHCASVWLLADEHGRKSAARAVPPPMIVLTDGGREVVPEGPFGSCSIHLDGRHPFARWLVVQGIAKREKGAVSFRARNVGSSASRALMYCQSVACLLREAGVPVFEVRPQLD